jgi:hypothetical protein
MSLVCSEQAMCRHTITCCGHQPALILDARVRHGYRHAAMPGRQRLETHGYITKRAY